MKAPLFHPTWVSFAILLASILHSKLAVAAPCSTLSFGSTGMFGSSNGVSSAVGDLNGDGKLDLAVVNRLSGNVSVLLGNGNGTFLAAVNYGAGLSPSSLAVGDLNGDTKPDLAVTDAASGTVLVLLGNGNGTFQAAVSYGAGDGSGSVAAGDFSGDAKPDLAVANRVDANVSVLLGNGNGSFGSASNYLVGVDPVSVAVGDFNGDGKRDLAVANAALFADPPSVSVLLGLGNGTFQVAVDYVAGTSPRSVAVGDFNGDGKVDLAVANYGAFDANNQFVGSSVSVLLGAGNGTFAAAVNYGAGAGPISLAVADFDSDGKSDLVVANNRSANVSVLLGNGNGTFQSPIHFDAGNNPVCVVAGDFSGDGQADLAVVNNLGVLVLINNTIDNIPPVITCPANLTVNAAPGACSSNVTFNVTASDNCAVTNLTSAPASGSAFAVGTTTVTSTARDSSGNSSQCTFTVTLLGTPMIITDQPADAMACNGGSATFTASANGTPPLAVQWQANTGSGFINLPNATATTLTVPANASTVGSYRAVFSNSCGTNTTSSASLIVGTSLSCNIDGLDVLCPNSMANTYSAPGFASYQWSISGNGNLVGTTNLSSVQVNSGSSGTLTLALQVTDSTGCIGNCTKVVTVQDTQAPVINCSTNLTFSVGPGACASNVSFTVTASDNCALTNLTSTPASGSSFPVGTTTVTSTARDSSGNSSTCTFTVTVNDVQTPLISCPADITVNAPSGSCAANVTFNVTASDNCGVANVTSVPASGSAFPVGTTTVISTALDTSGNNSQCIFTVTVNDTQPPVITCPANRTVNAAPGSCTSNVTFTVTATDNCGTPGVTSVPESGFAFPVGTTTVTSTAEDSSGNTSTCTFRVTVLDVQSPTITCPANRTVNTAPGQCTSTVTFTATATDNCPGTTVTSVPASGFAFPTGTTTVTSTARDSSGNSTTCSFTVTVMDLQPPAITCPANRTVNAAPGACTSNLTFNVTATDNCTVTSIASQPASGFAFPLGLTTVTSTARDSSGNSSTCTFTVTVNDSQPPVITCPANLTVNAIPGTCTSNVTFNVTATDNCAVTNTATVPASGFAFPVGLTTVTSTARDSSGNTSTCTFTVRVLDSQPPVITCPANLTVNAASGACANPLIFAVTATDNCAVANVTSVPASGFAFPIGTTTVTSTAQDSSGNSSQCSFTVTVLDTQPPVITSCPSGRTVNAAPGVCSSNVTFNVTAADNCALTSLTSVPASGFAFPLGTTTVTTTARDSSGNSSQCIFTVTVISTPMSITDQPSDAAACNGGTAAFTASAVGTQPITVQWQADTGSGFANLPNATTTTLTVPANASTVGSYRAVFSNPCGTTTSASARLILGTSLSCNIDGLDVLCPGSTGSIYSAPGFATYQWSISGNGSLVGPTNNSSVAVSAGSSGTLTLRLRVTDSTGCVGNCTKLATLLDTQPPVLNGLPAPMLNVQCLADVPAAPAVTASDNCSGNLTVTYTPNESGDPCNRSIRRTWSAVDNSGNAASFTQTITVHDDTNPILTQGTIAGSYNTVAEAEAAALAATAASDNCSAVTKTVSTVGNCPAIVTVTGADACGNRQTKSYNTCISATGVALAIVRNNASVLLSWPFPSTGFILESKASLGLANWQAATESRVTNNGRLEVTVPANQRERYFRLHKP